MPDIETQSGDLTPENVGGEEDTTDEGEAPSTEEAVNPQKEEEPEKQEEAPAEEQETSKEPEKSPSEIEEANKKLYARMKKAEDEAKQAKEALKKEAPKESNDKLGLAKLVSSLRDYSSEELDDIALIARAKDVSLEEATQTEEAKTLVAARREKVAKEKKAPLPSSSFVAGKSAKDIAKMSEEEHKALWEKARKRGRRQQE